MSVRSCIYSIAAVLVLPFIVFGCTSEPATPVSSDAQYGKLPLPPGDPPPQETNAWVVIYGDTHTGTGSRSIHQSIISKAIAFHASHIFHVGDLTEDGNDSQQWADFKSDISPINPYPIKYYPALGEHEDPTTYFSEFPGLPSNGGQADPYYYYVEHLTSLFIVLDVSSPGATAPAGWAAQKAWLEGVLAAHAGQNKFRFVFFHNHSMKTNAGAQRASYAAELDDIFQEYEVDAVFMGHTHGYQRWNVGGVHYIVTGGGGAALDNVQYFPPACVASEEYHYVQMFLSGDNGTLTVKDLSGNVLDALTLEKGGSPPPPTELRVAVHGDTHGGQSATADQTHAKVVARIVNFGPDVVLNTGDVVETGSNPNHWSIYNQIRSAVCDVPYFPTLGNHDDDDPAYFENHPYLPKNTATNDSYFYYVDMPFARFICLQVDKQGTTPVANWATQKTWLQGALTGGGDVFKFVFFHVPGYSVPTAENRGIANYVREIDAMLTQHAHAVFTGHIHSYQRHDTIGIPYVVTGGAGGFLHTFDPVPPGGYPPPPKLQVHNYVEMVLTENQADVTVWGSSEQDPLGPINVLADSYTIAK